MMYQQYAYFLYYNSSQYFEYMPCVSTDNSLHLLSDLANNPESENYKEKVNGNFPRITQIVLGSMFKCVYLQSLCSLSTQHTFYMCV